MSSATRGHGPFEELVFATGNRGKLAELQSMVAGCGLRVRSLRDFTSTSAEETGLTFVENAILKARHACRHSGLPALADDSGIAVDALGGAPGVHSARFAGPEALDSSNNTKLLAALAGVPEAERTARFICVLALLRHAEDPLPIVCSGIWEGRILESPRGSNGFGYDPLFYVPEFGCASAELPPETKNRASHRAQAFAALMARLATPGA